MSSNASESIGSTTVPHIGSALRYTAGVEDASALLSFADGICRRVLCCVVRVVLRMTDLMRVLCLCFANAFVVRILCMLCVLLLFCTCAVCIFNILNRNLILFSRLPGEFATGGSGNCGKANPFVLAWGSYLGGFLHKPLQGWLMPQSGGACGVSDEMRFSTAV